MDKIEFLQLETQQGLQDFVIIENLDGSFTSMTKAHYDELEAAKENGTIS